MAAPLVLPATTVPGTARSDGGKIARVVRHAVRLRMLRLQLLLLLLLRPVREWRDCRVRLLLLWGRRRGCWMRLLLLLFLR